jgi:AraC-like DNA-binding protein
MNKANNEDIDLDTELSIEQAKVFTQRGLFYDQDIYLLDNVDTSCLPENKRQLKCMLMLYNIRGGITFDTKDETITTHEHDLIILRPSDTVFYKNSTEEYKGKAILISPQNYTNLSNGLYSVSTLSSKIDAAHSLRLSCTERELFYFCFEQIERNLLSDSISRLQLSLIGSKFMLLNCLDKICVSQEDALTKSVVFKNFIKEVELHLQDNYNIQKYSQLVNVASATLEKEVRKHTGLSAKQYIRLRTAYDICMLIKEGTTSEKEIMRIENIKSTAAFAAMFRKVFGFTLTHYLSLSEDERQNIIHHTIPAQIYQ